MADITFTFELDGQQVRPIPPKQPAKVAKSAPKAAAPKADSPGTIGAAINENLAKSRELERQAIKWHELVRRNEYMDKDLRRYYTEKAAEAEREAARLRGEPVEPESPVEPLSKSVVVVL